MSSTVPFNQWVFPSLGSAGPIDPRLTWPLAGSFVLHVVMVSVSVMSVRFLPAVELPEQSYHVTLVTLPERRSSHKHAPGFEQGTPSRTDKSLKPATPPARRPAPVATPQPSVHKPAPGFEQGTEKVVEATAPPRQSRPSFSRAAISLKVPQLAAEEPVFQKQEPPVRSATEASPSAESLTRAIDSVRIPQVKKSRPANSVSRAAPQASESVPRNPEHKVRERSPKARSIVTPPPPLLASVSVGNEPVPMTPPEVVPPPVVPPKHAPGFEQGSERAKRERDIAALPIPELPAMAASPPVSIPVVPAATASPPVSIPVVPAAASPPVSIPMAPAMAASPPISIPAVPAAASPPVSIQVVSETQAESTTLQVEGSSPESSPEESPYVTDIESKIDLQWVVSTMHPVPVILRFRVERTGQVTGLTVEQSSGNDAYDSMAKRAVTAASPFPPFPPTVTDDYLVIHHTFKFLQRS